MTLQEYQSNAITTAKPSSLNMPYMALGLAGEAGEVANKVKKFIRDQMTLQDETAARAALLAELGDVLWYVAGAASVLNVNLEDIARENLAKLAKRQAEGKIGGNGDNR